MMETTSADLAALAIKVTEIARRAGAEILEIYTAGGGATTIIAKSDDSPLTLADLRAHQRILAELGALTPELPILSEESAQVPFEERQRWARYWLVDPLDGTKEFLSCNGEFTVNIALIDDHAPILGVVYAPARDTLYLGVPQDGAWKMGGSSAAGPIRVDERAKTPVRVVGSKSHLGTSLDRYLEALGPHTLLSIGSSLKFCLVAEGAADLYPRLGPTYEWDTAAGQAVLVAAGGVVVTAAGAPLEYNRKAVLVNPEFLAYADPDRDWLAPLALHSAPMVQP